MPWKLSSDDIVNLPIERGKLPKGESGELLSSRVDPRVVRRIREIVEQKQYIAFGTLSDFQRWCFDLGLQFLGEQQTDRSLSVYFAEQKLDQLIEAQNEVKAFIIKMDGQIREAKFDENMMDYLRSIANEFCSALGNDGVTDEVMGMFR